MAYASDQSKSQASLQSKACMVIALDSKDVAWQPLSDIEALTSGPRSGLHVEASWPVARLVTVSVNMAI